MFNLPHRPACTGNHPGPDGQEVIPNTAERHRAPSTPKRPSHFFALRPAPGAVGELREARGGSGLGGSPVRDERLHVTLFWIGYDHPGTPAIVAAAREAAATVAAAAFRISFDQLVAAEDRLLLRQSEPQEHLHAFQRRLAAALARRGVRAERRWCFDPHVTLRRGPSGAAAAAVDPIAWTATEFVLIHSLPAPFRHRELGRWPLRAVGDQETLSSPSSSPSQ